MVTIHRENNRMLLDISKSIQDAQTGKMAEAQQEARMLAVSRRCPGARPPPRRKWKNGSRDWLNRRVPHAADPRGVRGFLKGPPHHLAPTHCVERWMRTYHIMQYEGDRTADVQYKLSPTDAPMWASSARHRVGTFSSMAAIFSGS